METHTTPPLLWREALGRNLRMRRAELGMTLAQISARSGVSSQYLSEIERGMKDPSSEVIEAIAAVLELPLPQVLLLAAVSMNPSSMSLSALQQAMLSQRLPTPVAPASDRTMLSLAA